MLLLLPACGIPPIQTAKPGPILPDSYLHGLTSAENASQLPIEDFFNDPTLVRLICQGLAGNQELKILNQDVLIARYNVLGLSGNYLPFVSLGLAAGLEKFSRFTPLGAAEHDLEYLPGKHFPEPEGNFLVAANVSWQVDIWRQLRNARDAGRLRFLATSEGRNYTVTRLVAEIADNYFMLMALDKRLENLDQIIALQERSLEVARAMKQGGRGTELGVQRFLAELSMNRSQKLIVNQQIIEVENRINFLSGRNPQHVERSSERFFDLNIHTLSVGVPAQLLQYRPDIREAERNLQAAGLDVKAARARFFPRLDIGGPPGPTGPNAPVGVQAFNPKYLFWSPESILVNVAGELVTPLINKRGIRADYLTANARQLQAVYNYQRVILNAYTEVTNRVAKVQNYSRSIEIKKQQVEALVASVDFASKLFQAARTGYMDVLFAQRDLWDARTVLIETKQQQLSAIVYVYQALGGGLLGCSCIDPALFQPGFHPVQSRQGGSKQSGTDQLPAPGKQPELRSGPLPDQSPPGGSDSSGTDQLPPPRKQSEQPSEPSSAPPGRSSELSSLPDLPSPGPAVE